MILLSSADVDGILASDPVIVKDAVRAGYLSLGEGLSVNPPSVFLRWSQQPRARIIALPAYFRGPSSSAAGVKWVSSFPGNQVSGLPRAHAMIILSDEQNGVPMAIMESSSISLRRTAASSILAAELCGFNLSDARVGIVGAGALADAFVIECVAQGIDLGHIRVSDTVARRAGDAVSRIQRLGVSGAVVTVPAAIRNSDIVVLATSAVDPWLDEDLVPGGRRLVLHLSLRDLHPNLLSNVTNVTDSIDHALREGTSLGRAVACGLDKSSIIELWQLFSSRLKSDGRSVVFSPFGLGVLDMAVAEAVYRRAVRYSAGYEWEAI